MRGQPGDTVQSGQKERPSRGQQKRQQQIKRISVESSRTGDLGSIAG